MSSAGANPDASTEVPEVETIDMKLEVVTLPVSDVDRAKRFYESLGWRLDVDLAAGDDFRAVQLTPPSPAGNGGTDIDVASLRAVNPPNPTVFSEGRSS
jgi:catechol 2,3-dioxygenase-like lactoylglutathione lyase family enzyme